MDEKPSITEEPRRASRASSGVDGVGAEKVRVEHSHQIMPDALVGLSDEELSRIGRKATFKLDAFILPSITIMYILNYLDRQVRIASLPPSLVLTPTEYC